jgi:hypothetical protein
MKVRLKPPRHGERARLRVPSGSFLSLFDFARGSHAVGLAQEGS